MLWFLELGLFLKGLGKLIFLQNFLFFLFGLCPILIVCVCVGPKWHFNIYLGKISSCSCIVLYVSGFICLLCVWWNAQMTFFCCFGLRWVPNFGNYHVFTFSICFKHWSCVLHTLPQVCLVMPWSCTHMHTTCALDAHTWSLDMFCTSLMLDKCCYTFST